jgi:hypothetical protein
MSDSVGIIGVGGTSRRLVFLLAGQSNMAGRAALDDEVGRSDPRILQLSTEDKWIAAADPLHPPQFGFAGTGPGMSFARALAEARPGHEIRLIPCALGATPLARWEPDGDLFQNAANRLRLALAEGESLAGLLWHQGETDARTEAVAATYETRLEAAVRAWRALPGAAHAVFVCGELGQFLSSSEFPGAEQVNAALRSVAARIPGGACISSAGLADKGDRKHFDTVSQRQLGRRYAEAFLKTVALETMVT